MAQIDEILDGISTWDDFYNIVKLLAGNYDALGTGTKYDISGYAGYYNDYYLGFGVWFIANGYGLATQNADGTIDVNLSDDSAVEAIEFLQKMYADGTTKTQASILFDEYFNTIYQNRIASFIYYPTWADSFRAKGIYASDVKVINIPAGPTAQETQNTKINPSFCLNYVLNKNATEEQKKAAAKYLLFMYDSAAYEAKIDYQYEEGVESFLLPPTKFTDNYLKEKILSTAPADWENSIVNAVNNLYVLKCDMDGWIHYVNTDLPALIKKDTVYTGDALRTQLDALTGRIYEKSLNRYNRNHQK